MQRSAQGAPIMTAPVELPGCGLGDVAAIGWSIVEFAKRAMGNG